MDSEYLWSIKLIFFDICDYPVICGFALELTLTSFKA